MNTQSPAIRKRGNNGVAAASTTTTMVTTKNADDNPCSGFGSFVGFRKRKLPASSTLDANNQEDTRHSVSVSGAVVQGSSQDKKPRKEEESILGLDGKQFPRSLTSAIQQQDNPLVSSSMAGPAVCATPTATIGPWNGNWSSLVSKFSFSDGTTRNHDRVDLMKCKKEKVRDSSLSSHQSPRVSRRLERPTNDPTSVPTIDNPPTRHRDVPETFVRQASLFNSNIRKQPRPPPTTPGRQYSSLSSSSTSTNGCLDKAAPGSEMNKEAISNNASNGSMTHYTWLQAMPRTLLWISVAIFLLALGVAVICESERFQRAESSPWTGRRPMADLEQRLADNSAFARSALEKGHVGALSGKTTTTTRKTALCLEGGGFPGFFYTLGQLQSIPVEQVPLYDYYCYSSACLCAVAFLGQLDLDQILQFAKHIQGQWQRGEISRFQVVPRFVESILPKLDHDDPHHDSPYRRPRLAMAATRETTTGPTTNSSNTNITGHDELWWLQNLHVITSVRNDNGFGVLPSIQSPSMNSSAQQQERRRFNEIHDPSNVPRLREVRQLQKLLLQTTWIPGATGNTLFLDNHMDGGFVVHKVQHVCERTMTVGRTWDMLINMLNTNLSREKALYFWECREGEWETVSYNGLNLTLKQQGPKPQKNLSKSMTHSRVVCQGNTARL